MQRELDHFNKQREAAGKTPIHIGIGINSGEVVAGYLGSSKALEYTVIGDTVNTGARLCSVAKAGEIIISHNTYELCGDRFEVIPLPPTPVKGKSQALRIYNVVGGAIKPIWANQNLVIENNRDSETRIVPPFEKELGPEGKATHGIDLAANRLTGSVIRHQDKKHVKTRGKWTPRTVNGMWGLFRFDYLVGTAAAPAEVTFTLPIPEDGTYQISLLYPSGKDRASNVPLTIVHADGKAEMKWDMKKGSRHGFATGVGKFRFKAGGTNTVTLSTRGTDGNVIADGVAFVKVAE
jgi:hypothetical protein